MTLLLALWIPCLPDLDLSANRRRTRHHMAQARDTATERERAAKELLLAWQAPSIQARLGVAPWPMPVEIHWTLHWPKGVRSRDADSYAALLKPWVDAMGPPFYAPATPKRRERSAPGLSWLPNDSLRYVARVSYGGVPSSPWGPGMELIMEAKLGQELTR